VVAYFGRIQKKLVTFYEQYIKDHTPGTPYNERARKKLAKKAFHAATRFLGIEKIFAEFQPSGIAPDVIENLVESFDATIEELISSQDTPEDCLFQLQEHAHIYQEEKKGEQHIIIRLAPDNQNKQELTDAYKTGIDVINERFNVQ